MHSSEIVKEKDYLVVFSFHVPKRMRNAALSDTSTKHAHKILIMINVQLQGTGKNATVFKAKFFAKTTRKLQIYN